MAQKIEEMSEDDEIGIEKQRNWVRDHFGPGLKHLYGTLEGKLSLLETILRQNWIEPNETWKLQSLGITFGDALAQKLKMHWVMVEDEHGRDAALHDQGTTIIVFPLTSISKRIERDETVDVRELFDSACQTIARIRSEQSSNGLF
ncbi:MAG: DUF3806 domain-containing protein [Bradyrhizobium sp.]